MSAGPMRSSRSRCRFRTDTSLRPTSRASDLNGRTRACNAFARINGRRAKLQVACLEPGYAADMATGIVGGGFDVVVATLPGGIVSILAAVRRIQQKLVHAIGQMRDRE